MQRNVGSTDSAVRIAIGAVLGALSLAVLANLVPLPALASPVLGVIALIALVTGATRTCGLYSLLGVRTDRSR